ncbi:hypothetical protein [Nocardioides mesophilus]|uniref:Uncharacterized protein n=1 Tax=Nocardioides mesophilus TaxID=433659 RepID=A0A7G9R6F8_9ACTN|nr:hypothetical protein [Nocardioides mesophilus]QNN51183.1 hypothetical protein H9L09_11005 [Nocardioides mesophilus]
MSDFGPLPAVRAWMAVGRCVGMTAVLVARARIHHPRELVGRELAFGDGTRARVYRETRVDRAPPADPCVLVVAFRLRRVRGWGHTAFRLESILNTPLFVGFPGMCTKLWLAHDERGVYRGLYEWDGPRAAEEYARSLWRVLALVSEPGSIDYRVVPGLRRDVLLEDPTVLSLGSEETAWWRLVAAA